jgi:hypothetical protein
MPPCWEWLFHSLLCLGLFITVEVRVLETPGNPISQIILKGKRRGWNVDGGSYDSTEVYSFSMGTYLLCFSAQVRYIYHSPNFSLNFSILG